MALTFVFKCKKCERRLLTGHHGLPPYCEPSCEEVDKIVGKGKDARITGIVHHKEFYTTEEF